MVRWRWQHRVFWYCFQFSAILYCTVLYCTVPLSVYHWLSVLSSLDSPNFTSPRALKGKGEENAGGAPWEICLNLISSYCTLIMKEVYFHFDTKHDIAMWGGHRNTFPLRIPQSLVVAFMTQFVWWHLYTMGLSVQEGPFNYFIISELNYFLIFFFKD